MRGGRPILDPAPAPCLPHLDVLKSIIAFVAQFRGSLPPAAIQAMEMFIGERRGLFEEAGGTPDVKHERNRAVVVLLAGLETQISFLLHAFNPPLRPDLN